MKLIIRLFCGVLLYSFSASIFAQVRTVNYNGQQLFLNGANLAWNNFARDIGPGETDFDHFANTFLQVHDHGGNAMRLWLHTNGVASPEFNDTGLVVGPGENTIQDLRKILDLAWEREVGMKLCLWSFDMLRLAYGDEIIDRNRLMLTDTAFTMAYINNSLIPMIDSLKGHPAIIAWEIFNEPELMTNEFGASDIGHVAMSDIQRFINLCAGAIHRTDTSAQVTSGAWSFKAMTDFNPLPKPSVEPLAYADKQQLETSFNEKYRLSLSANEIEDYLQRISAQPNKNYYSDSLLTEAGGDEDGVLDFYSVHYYSALGGDVSPFRYSSSYWRLDKPIVVAEFAMTTNDGIPKENLFKTIYQYGYAGALPWSWSDNAFSSQADMLAGMQYMWDNHKDIVDVNGISGDWPLISLTAPANNQEFPADTTVTITAEASDKDGSVILVEFFANDEKIGEAASEPYSISWSGMENGIYSVYASVTDNTGNKRASNKITIKIGKLPFVRLEAESKAVRSGTGITVRSHPGASGGSYVQMAAQTGTVTWKVNISKAGSYEADFGYRLSYDRPKTQFINVNGARAAELIFDGAMNAWLEKPVTLNLIQGLNEIQMELSWGWMDLDYLSIPSDIFIAVNDKEDLIINSYFLAQNYPNPFNPSTTIKYSLAKSGKVNLSVYDILGRHISTLVNELQDAGAHSISFNARGLASGIYIYRITAGNFTESRRMIIIK